MPLLWKQTALQAEDSSNKSKGKMKYSVTLNLKSDNNLYKSLLPDISKTPRAGWDVKKKKGFLEIKIEAEDVSALKAFLSSVTKLLEIHEKLDRVKDEC